MGEDDSLRSTVGLCGDDSHDAVVLGLLGCWVAGFLGAARRGVRAADDFASRGARRARAVAHSAARYTHDLRVRNGILRTQRPLAPTGTARMKKTLFLNPPSFEGFDGGAGSR